LSFPHPPTAPICTLSLHDALPISAVVIAGGLRANCGQRKRVPMIIVMSKSATDADVKAVVERLKSIGCEAHVSVGQYRTVIGAVGDRETIRQLPWEAMPGVERAVPVMKPFKV